MVVRESTLSTTEEMMKKSPSLPATTLHQLQSRSSCPQNRCSPHREQYRSLLKHCVLHRCLVCSTCSPVWERKRTKRLVCSPDLTWQEIPGVITMDPAPSHCDFQGQRNSRYSGQGGIKREQVNKSTTLRKAITVIKAKQNSKWMQEHP